LQQIVDYGQSQRKGTKRDLQEINNIMKNRAGRDCKRLTRLFSCSEPGSAFAEIVPTDACCPGSPATLPSSSQPSKLCHPFVSTEAQLKVMDTKLTQDCFTEGEAQRG